MNRTIKFRAWHKHKKYMYSVISYNWKSKAAKEENGGWHKDIELMQYTGLKDKNGKEIYEGDILNFNGDNFYSVVEYKLPKEVETPGFYTVEKKPKYYRVSHYPKEGRIHFIPHLTIKPEIIGNIYENPDILLDKKQ